MEKYKTILDLPVEIIYKIADLILELDPFYGSFGCKRTSVLSSFFLSCKAIRSICSQRYLLDSLTLINPSTEQQSLRLSTLKRITRVSILGESTFSSKAIWIFDDDGHLVKTGGIDLFINPKFCPQLQLFKYFFHPSTVRNIDIALQRNPSEVKVYCIIKSQDLKYLKDTLLAKRIIRLDINVTMSDGLSQEGEEDELSSSSSSLIFNDMPLLQSVSLIRSSKQFDPFENNVDHIVPVYSSLKETRIKSGAMFYLTKLLEPQYNPFPPHTLTELFTNYASLQCFELKTAFTHLKSLFIRFDSQVGRSTKLCIPSTLERLDIELSCFTLVKNILSSLDNLELKHLGVSSVIRHHPLHHQDMSPVERKYEFTVDKLVVLVNLDEDMTLEQGLKDGVFEQFSDNSLISILDGVSCYRFVSTGIKIRNLNHCKIDKISKIKVPNYKCLDGFRHCNQTFSAAYITASAFRNTVEEGYDIKFSSATKCIELIKAI